jgi:methionyl-tRNA formyltransferase
MEGEQVTGVTIMRVVQALDAGPMLSHATRAVGPDETSVEVERDLSQLGATLLRSAVDLIAAGDAHEVPQDESLATYAPRLTRADGRIDWRQSALVIHNLVRGLHPWPHASTWLDGRRVVILRTSRPSRPDRPPRSAEPGEVVEARGDTLIVAGGDGECLSIERLQLEGGRPLSAREFLAGHRLQAGARFAVIAG